MKETLTFVGLVVLSILYLFEVDFSHLETMNYVAFAIIALTLIPLLWSLIAKVMRKRKEHSRSYTPPRS